MLMGEMLMLWGVTIKTLRLVYAGPTIDLTILHTRCIYHSLYYCLQIY